MSLGALSSPCGTVTGAKINDRSIYLEKWPPCREFAKCISGLTALPSSAGLDHVALIKAKNDHSAEEGIPSIADWLPRRPRM
jgi:hypothetical protein